MSDMPGQREIFSICFQCLRYNRVVQGGLPLLRGANSRILFGAPPCCCHYSTVNQDSKKQREFSIEENPFFDKYKDRLKQFADTDPTVFADRLSQLKEEKEVVKSKPDDAHSSAPASQPVPRSASYTKSKGLDSLMKLDLIQDKIPAEIEQIWKEHHAKKDCVFAVLKKEDFEDLMAKGRKCPTFIYPLPRQDGFEFILMQFDGKDLQFTPLSMYQILRENAPACMTLVHYTELIDKKGIVLMSGQYDDKVLKREEALMLVQMMTIYYGKNSPRFDRVEAFNHKPDTFDYNQLIEEYKSMYTQTLK